MANQYLATEVNVSRTNNSTLDRTIVMSGTDTTVVASPTKTSTSTMSGTDTTVQEVPTITRTNTRGAVAVSTVTHEDEGFVINFKVAIRSLLGSVPPGAADPPNPI